MYSSSSSNSSSECDLHGSCISFFVHPEELIDYVDMSTDACPKSCSTTLILACHWRCLAET